MSGNEKNTLLERKGFRSDEDSNTILELSQLPQYGSIKESLPDSDLKEVISEPPLEAEKPSVQQLQKELDKTVSKIEALAEQKPETRPASLWPKWNGWFSLSKWLVPAGGVALAVGGNTFDHHNDGTGSHVATAASAVSAISIPVFYAIKSGHLKEEISKKHGEYKKNHQKCQQKYNKCQQKYQNYTEKRSGDLSEEKKQTQENPSIELIGVKRLLEAEAYQDEKVSTSKYRLKADMVVSGTCAAVGGIAAGLVAVGLVAPTATVGLVVTSSILGSVAMHAWSNSEPELTKDGLTQEIVRLKDINATLDKFESQINALEVIEEMRDRFQKTSTSNLEEKEPTISQSPTSSEVLKEATINTSKFERDSLTKDAWGEFDDVRENSEFFGENISTSTGISPSATSSSLKEKEPKYSPVDSNSLHSLIPATPLDPLASVRLQSQAPVLPTPSSLPSSPPSLSQEGLELTVTTPTHRNSGGEDMSKIT